jgi:hypothetical protein
MVLASESKSPRSKPPPNVQSSRCTLVAMGDTNDSVGLLTKDEVRELVVDDDSDDWETNDFSDLAVEASGEKSGTIRKSVSSNEESDPEALWETKLSPVVSQHSDEPVLGSKTNSIGDAGEPMIFVDMTDLSKGSIHSKFDANSVNDHGAVKELRQKIERDYQSFACNEKLVADSVVIPCGSSVWRSALVELRKARPGHYICPIFPSQTGKPTST